MSQLKPANPVYQQDESELNKLNQSLDQMTAKLQTQAEQQVDAKVRADLDRTGAVDAQLTSQLNATTALATTSTPKMQRANELNADILRLQQRYAAIDTRLHNVELDSSAPAAVHLSSAAQPPVSANSGMRHKLVLLALPFALFFGLFSALGANALDRHVHTPGDVQHILGFAPLGVLPEATHVTPAVEQEYLLRLAAGIDHAAASAHAKTFVVTGVGTSDLAHALGTTLARIGRRTLTLDSASVLAPSEAHAAETGATPEGSVIEQNLRRLSAANEVVLIDAPPLLLSAGTEYLARFTDATLLVCDSGRTERSDVARAAQLLDRIQAPGVGAILTSIPPRTADPEFLADLKATQDRIRTKRLCRPQPTFRCPPPISPMLSAFRHARPNPSRRLGGKTATLARCRPERLRICLSNPNRRSQHRNRKWLRLCRRRRSPRCSINWCAWSRWHIHKRRPTQKSQRRKPCPLRRPPLSRRCIWKKSRRSSTRRATKSLPHGHRRPNPPGSERACPRPLRLRSLRRRCSRRPASPRPASAATRSRSRSPLRPHRWIAPPRLMHC